MYIMSMKVNIKFFGSSTKKVKSVSIRKTVFFSNLFADIMCVLCPLLSLIQFHLMESYNCLLVGFIGH